MRCVAVLILLPSAFFLTTADAQDKTPLPTIQIAQPSAGQELTAETEIRVTVQTPEGGTALSALYAGLGGPPWVKLESATEPGQWTGQIDSALVPNGKQILTVVSDNRKARAFAEITVNNPLKIFFADLHGHTAYSDGSLLPQVAHDYARNVAKLDVFSLTDHLELAAEAEWLDIREQAWDANEDGRFVAIPGLEWTKKWGHLNIYDPKTRLWPDSPQAFYEAIAAAGVVAKFNHPGDGTQLHGGLQYSEIADQAVQMMEVRRPAEEKAFLRALAFGWHIAPDGSTDTHSPNWGNLRSWTGILAPGLSKRNVLDALMNRRCYSTLDRNCRLVFELNGAAMGAIVEQPVGKVDVLVDLEDSDTDETITKIELFEDGEIVQTAEPNAAMRRWTTSRTPDSGGHYYFVKVTQGDQDSLWSAPIWITVEKQP